MNTQELVALRIQQLCAEHGYNHGVSRNPGIVTIKLLCDGLGISLYDFFDTDAFRQMQQELK